MQSALKLGLAAAVNALRAQDDARSQSVAAIVYANEEYPDALFGKLVEACSAAGIVTAGVLQYTASAESDHRCDVYLKDIASGHLIRLFENRGSEARGCRLDRAALAEVTARVETSLEDVPGLLLLNKFGKAECEGKGMRELIASAMQREIPVLIGVPVRNLDPWREFAGEFAVEMPADLPYALQWLAQQHEDGQIGLNPFRVLSRSRQ